MKVGGRCVDEGLKHFNRIRYPISDSEETTMLKTYETFEEEDRGHGNSGENGGMIKCGDEGDKPYSELGGNFLPNATVEIRNRRPCHSSYEFKSQGVGFTDVLGEEGTLFASTHHLGSISVSSILFRALGSGFRIQGSPSNLGSFSVQFHSIRGVQDPKPYTLYPIP